MDKLTPEFLLNLLGMVATAGAVYGAIKGDIKAMHQRLNDLNEQVVYNRGRIDTLHNRRSTDHED
jgi:hypothetical protein